MALESVTKQSTEEYDFAVEHYGKLPPGRSISTATVTSINNVSLATTTTAVIVTDSVTVSGTQVRFTLKAGQTNGDVHKVTVRANLDNGTGPVETDFLLNITDT